jgi:hypothetical protein
MGHHWLCPTTFLFLDWGGTHQNKDCFVAVWSQCTDSAEDTPAGKGQGQEGEGWVQGQKKLPVGTAKFSPRSSTRSVNLIGGF